MSRRESRAILDPFAAFLSISLAPRLLVPRIVMDVELKWKFKWPWMHLRSRVQLLSRALLPRVAVSLAN
jgi:hypothetical protein